MKRIMLTIGMAGLALSAPLRAQTDSTPVARAEDVGTLDGMLKAYYDVVSGPAGGRADRVRDASLHVPDARVGIPVRGAGGRPTIRMMSLGEYHDRFGGPRQRPFYEWEIHRVTQRFGNVANVWSTYASSDAPNGSVRGRGINSIQLYFDGTRWWIVGWIFDSEREDNPIPPEFLPPHEP
ncbi:MAG TPA: hypothetical protein VGA37_15965 [Gemmatimonadales bacterium]